MAAEEERPAKKEMVTPIILKSQCLMCHGILGKDIAEETYTLIKTHYPTDQAVDNREGELRGLWSINFGNIDDLEKVADTPE